MGAYKKTQPAFVDLYEILEISPDAETSDLLRRIAQGYSEAQKNLNHSNPAQRLHAQQMFHVYLPQARQVLLSEASRAAYDKQRDHAITSTRNNHEAAQKAQAARRQEEARIAQEVRSYSINTALDRTLVFALMATTLLFLADVLFSSTGGYPFHMTRAVGIGLGITFTAFGLVWHFQALRQRVARKVRGAVDKNKVSVIHRQSERCKRAAFIEGAVLLIGLSVLNALDERFLPGGYPLGSRLLFNICMALIMSVVFFAGRQFCIHCNQPEKARNTVKSRKA